MAKKKIDPADVLRAIAETDDELLDWDYPEALVDEELREAGIDPREVEVRGEVFMKRLMAERADADRKASTTRLRSTGKQHSSLPPVREKAPSESGPINEE